MLTRQLDCHCRSVSLVPLTRSGSSKIAGKRTASTAHFGKWEEISLAIINSDDCLTAGAARAVCEAFARYPKAGIVFGGVDWIDKEGRSIGRHHGEILNLEHILDIYSYWWNRKQWVQPEVFFRRSLYDAAGGFDENLQFSVRLRFLDSHSAIATDWCFDSRDAGAVPTPRSAEIDGLRARQCRNLSGRCPRGSGPILSPGPGL